jgi:hypothetical protein
MILGLSLAGTGIAHADSLMEFQVDKGKKSLTQPVLIKNGQLLIKAAGGNRQLDVLYQRENDRLTLIDHKNQAFTPVTEEKVGQLARQAEGLKPLVQGFAGQLQKLSPKQKAKWEEMLGGVSLDDLSGIQKAAKPARVAKAGQAKRIAGVACQPMTLVQGKKTAAEVCVADPKALRLAEDDNATLRGLIALTQKVAARAQGVAAQFGFPLPAEGLNELAGVPLEVRDYSGKRPLTLVLSRVSGAELTADPFQVPAGYRAQELALWH